MPFQTNDRKGNEDGGGRGERERSPTLLGGKE